MIERREYSREEPNPKVVKLFFQREFDECARESCYKALGGIISIENNIDTCVSRNRIGKRLWQRLVRPKLPITINSIP